MTVVRDLKRMSRECSDEYERTGLPAWRVAAREAYTAAVLFEVGDIRAAHMHMRAGQSALELGTP